MILITQLYKTHSVRLKEIEKSLKKNVENPYIKEIILLNETPIELEKELDKSKIKEVIVNQRLSYKIAFEYAENNITNNEIVILANSDIWFDNTLNLIKNYDLNKQIISLSRYDLKDNDNYELFSTHNSQDCWIFKNPICLQYDHNFQLGKGGCDNRIAWIINNSKKNGIKYEIINPAKSIKAYHEHKSNIRNWIGGEIKGPYHFIKIT